MVVLGCQLALVILGVFSNLKDSLILPYTDVMLYKCVVCKSCLFVQHPLCTSEGDLGRLDPGEPC